VGYSLIQKLEDGKARYRFDDVLNGKRFRKQVTCLPSVAKSLYHRWLKDRMDGVMLNKYRFFEKLDEYLEWISNHNSAGWCVFVSHSLKMFKRFFSDMYLDNIRRHHIEEYISWRGSHPDKGDLKRVKNSTLNREAAVLSHFFNWCIEREYYSRNNPASRVKLKEVSEREIRLTGEQIRELLDKSSGKMRTSILLALGCGLRRGEIVGLKWSHIDFDTSMIHLPSGITKGQKRRVVCMPDFVVEHLSEVRRENPFSERVLAGWNKWGFESAWGRFRERLSFTILSEEVGRLRFHDLRHVYAQSLRDAGVPMQDIQVLMGHSSVRTTEERYAMFGGVDAKEKVNRIEKVIPFRQTG
jgi:integrase